MKCRNKQSTRLQRWFRKYDSIEKSTCAIYGYKFEKHKPRWRQVRKARAKRYASMNKKLKSYGIDFSDLLSDKI